MAPHRISKLIGVFLILSAVSSSFSLLFLKNRVYSTPRISYKEETSPLKVGNAFVESIPTTSRQFAEVPNPTVRLDSEGLPVFLPSTNLTKNLTYELTRELIRTNPDGPQQPDGSTGVLSPTSAGVDDMITQSIQYATTTDLFGLDPEVKMIENYTEADIRKYISILNSIFEETEYSSKFKDLVAQEPTTETIHLQRLVYENVAGRLATLPVPLPFANVHQDLLRFYVHQSRILELILDDSDPLKGLLAVQNANQVLRDDVDTLDADLDLLFSILKPSDSSYQKDENKILSFLNDLVGVKTAHAIPVAVIANVVQIPYDTLIAAKTTLTAIFTKLTSYFTAASFAQKVWEIARKFLTETLKNKILHLLTQQIVQWIDGGGDPQFVQDWQGFMSDAFNQAAGSAIEQTWPQLCAPFGPLIRLQLTRIYLTPSQVSCTLTQIANNAQSFYDSFSNGGWLAYGESALPAGNYYGAIFEASNVVDAKAQRAQASANSEAQAAQGFLSTKICNDGSKPKKFNQPVPDPDHPGDFIVENKEKCPGGETPFVTTPGGALGHTLYSALGSPIQHIVNVQDFVALVSAMVDTALNRLIREGIAAVKGGRGDTGLTGAGAGYNPNRITRRLSDVPEVCQDFPAGSQMRRDCVDAANSAESDADHSPDQPSTSTTPEGLVQQGQINRVCGSLVGGALTDCTAGLNACTGKVGAGRTRCEQAAFDAAQAIATACPGLTGQEHDTCAENARVCAPLDTNCDPNDEVCLSKPRTLRWNACLQVEYEILNN